jgi:2-dehydropantoate 2-reductase
MRLAIIGCGALGSLFAAALSSRSDLLMLGHWPEQLARLRSYGLTMIHPDGGLSNHMFTVTDDPSKIATVDLALVLVKTYQTDRAALEIKQLLARDGLAVTLQNGLGNVDVLARVLGPRRVTQGITAVGATMQEPGVIRFAGHGPTHLAQTVEKHTAVDELAGLMNTSGFETYLTGDLESLAWGKLAINSGINPLTALLRVPNGYLARNSQARKLMFAAAEETAAIAQALHINLPYPDVSQRILEVAKATADNQSSMLQDVLRGSQTEIDAICGAVVGHGHSIGMSTPINAEFLRLIQALPSSTPQEPLVSRLESLQGLLEQKKGSN